MTIDINSVGSFIFGFLCALLFLFIYAGLTIGSNEDDDDE